MPITASLITAMIPCMDSNYILVWHKCSTLMKIKCNSVRNYIQFRFKISISFSKTNKKKQSFSTYKIIQYKSNPVKVLLFSVAHFLQVIPHPVFHCCDLLFYLVHWNATQIAIILTSWSSDVSHHRTHFRFFLFFFLEFLTCWILHQTFSWWHDLWPDLWQISNAVFRTNSKPW